LCDRFDYYSKVSTLLKTIVQTIEKNSNNISNKIITIFKKESVGRTGSSFLRNAANDLVHSSGLYETARETGIS